jgi:hypothetical protein
VNKPALWSSAAYLAILACNPVPPDGGGGFTGDTDIISTAVEINPPNSRYNFDTLRFDANPSLARGQPTNGSLEDGINLPDEHAGYHHHYGIPRDSLDKDDWGALHTINRIEGVARDWIDPWMPCINPSQNPTPPPKFSVGDISKYDEATGKFGGPWLPDHPGLTHQNGLNVDLRYARIDNGLDPLTLDGNDAAFYDPGATADLMSCFLYYEDVTLLITDTTLARINFRGDPRIRSDAGHRDHWHIQIKDYDGPFNLRRAEVAGP